MFEAKVTKGGTLKITVPIYHGVRKKYMIGLNWYGTAHYRARNKVKQEYSIRVGKVLESLENDVNITSPFTTHFKIYYKNKVSDGDNLVAVAGKFLLDALQEHGIVDDDNVQHHTSSSWEVVEQDRHSPRIEVTIKGIKNDK
jgi:Holliday junction resolvase RusA-like endonuclease